MYAPLVNMLVPIKNNLNKSTKYATRREWKVVTTENGPNDGVVWD